MIYSQTLFMYILSIITSLGLFKRLQVYLKDYFSLSFSYLVAATILLHPLSIDALIAPNLLSGTIAFWLFLESLFFIRMNKLTMALLLMLASSACNIAYSLFPIYFFLKMDKKKTHLVPILVYLLLLGFYLGKLILHTDHNPLTFFTYYIKYLTLPISLNAFTPALLPFSPLVFSIALTVILLILWGQRNKPYTQFLFPLLFLPVIGDLIHQWAKPYLFWSEVIFTCSNFLCITFAFITIIAILLPKKYFVSYAILMAFLSWNTANQWYPISNLLRQSVLNLPDDYKEIATTKRTLAWQLLNEGKNEEGKNLLIDLAAEFPENAQIKSDLKLLQMKP